jgi:MFS family permease
MSDSKAAAVDLNAVKTTPYSWFVAVLVALTYGVSFIARNVWSTALPVAHESLGITMAAAGGLMTAFYIGYVVSNFVTGFVVDKIGPRLTLGLATLLTGIFTLLIPVAPHYAALFVLRVLAGASAGPLFSGVTKYQISYFSPATRATAMGLMMSGVSIGSTVATMVFAPVVQNQSWRTAFTYAAITAIVVAVLFFIFAKEQGAAAVRSTRTLTAEEKAVQGAGLKAIVLKRSFVLGTIACFLSIGTNMAYTTYLVAFFTRSRGFSLTEAGLLAGSTFVIGLISGTLTGIIADILKKKRLMCVFGCVTGAFCTFLIMRVTNAGALVVILVARGLFIAFMGTPLNALQAEAAAGPFVGRAMGIYNGIAQSGAILFPLLFGFFLDVSHMNFDLLFWGIVIGVLLCGCFILFMDEKKIEKKLAAAA